MGVMICYLTFVESMVGLTPHYRKQAAYQVSGLLTFSGYVTAASWSPCRVSAPWVLERALSW
jgi:hypothetical protein